MPDDAARQRQLSSQILQQRWLDSDELQAPSSWTLGRYEVLRPLGRGATSEVLLAQDPLMGRRVAIKVWRQDVAANRARVEREIRVLASLEHPHVVQIYDAGVTDEGQQFFVMEFVGDRTLEDAELSRDEALDVLVTVARACHWAHEKGIVHRDLKPANVLLGEVPKVADFGVAKLLVDSESITAKGGMVGTPAFMAPEQIAGSEITPATDVYALGVMLYEQLCGRPPFEAESLGSLALLIARQPPPPPSRVRADVPPGLEAVALRALAKRPDDRFPSAAAFADALEACHAAPAAGASAPPARLLAAGALALLVLVGLLGFALTRGDPSPDPAVAAAAEPPAEPPPEDTPPVGPRQPAEPPPREPEDVPPPAEDVLPALREVVLDTLERRALFLDAGAPRAAAQRLLVQLAEPTPESELLAALLELTREGQAPSLDTVEDPEQRALLEGWFALGRGDATGAEAAFSRAAADAELASRARVGSALAALGAARQAPTPQRALSLALRALAAVRAEPRPHACYALAAAWRWLGDVTGLGSPRVPPRCPPPLAQALRDACTTLEAAAADRPDDPALQDALGCALLIRWLRLGQQPADLRGAEQALLRAIAVDGDAVSPRLSLATLRLLRVKRGQRGELAGARAALDAARRIAPAHVELPVLTRYLRRLE